MLKSFFCDYSEEYIVMKRRITVTGAGADAAARQTDERNKQVILKSCAPFTYCINEINNTQIDNATDLNFMMPMYHLEICQMLL